MGFKRTDHALTSRRNVLLYSSAAFAICFAGLTWTIGGSELLNTYRQSFEKPASCILWTKNPFDPNSKNPPSPR
jgi:hypothetical protein